MTEEECACLEALSKAWNLFLNLPQHHPDDQVEFRRAIHAAQNILLARIALRGMKVEEPGGHSEP